MHDIVADRLEPGRSSARRPAMAGRPALRARSNLGCERGSDLQGIGALKTSCVLHAATRSLDPKQSRRRGSLTFVSPANVSLRIKRALQATSV